MTAYTLKIVYKNEHILTVICHAKTIEKAYDIAFKYCDDFLPNLIQDYDLAAVELYDETNARHRELFRMNTFKDLKAINL